MSNTEDMVRRHLRGLSPYEPIIPPEELAHRFGIPAEQIIKLDGNENPYGCSPRVNLALSRYANYHIYPDPEQVKLREALSGYLGIDDKHLIMGSGSDEIIDLLLRLFLEPGDEVINCPPTFGMYPFCTGVCGGMIVDVPRDRDFGLNIPAIKQAVSIRSKIIFLASPNNPSGNIASREEIMKLLESKMVVVVDEAYYEFSGRTVVDMVTHYDNLIVLRTFSKWAGLAGLRVGYGICPPHIIRYLEKIKPPYNINVAAEIAAQESLADIPYLRKEIQAIVNERERFFIELKQIEFLKVFPSQANFILCSVLNGKAKDIYHNLQRKGIFIRYYNNPLLKDYIRISIGKPEHTDALVAALREMANAGGW